MASKAELKGMTDKALEALIESARQELEAREEKRRQEALDQIKAIAEEAGLSLSELSRGTRRKARTPVPPKYRNPDDPGQTWSGRGKQPRWLTAALESGKTLEEMAA